MTIFAADIVETSSTLGSGTYSLNGPAVAYRAFNSSYVTGDTPYYVVRNTGDTKYEINRFGTFVQGNPDSLSRNVWLSSNGNAPVNWIAGDLPLLVYVPASTELLEHITQGLKATARSVYLKFGLWWKKDTPGAGTDTLMVFNGATDIPFATVNNSTNSVALVGALAPGIIAPYAGATAPAGWLLCDGRSLSRTTYNALYNAIGTAYGSVDGASFNIPDLMGRVIIGRDNMSGTAQGRVTSASGFNGVLLGSTSGVQTESVAVSVNVNVSGSISGTASGTLSLGGSTQPVPLNGNANTGSGGSFPIILPNTQVGLGGGYATGSLGVGGTFSGSGSSTSGSTATASNMPPGMIMNYIISTGGV